MLTPAATPIDSAPATAKRPMLSDEARVWAYAIFLGIAAVSALLAVKLIGYPIAAWWVLVGLAGIAAIADSASVTVGRHTVSSVSFLPLVFSAVVFGPLTAGVVAATACLTGLLFDRGRFPLPYLRAAVWTSAGALIGVAAGLSAGAVGVRSSSTFTVFLMASLAAAVANHAADALLNIITLWVRGHNQPLGFLRTTAPYLVLSLPLYVPFIALLSFGYWAYSPWVVGALLVAGLALHRLLHLYREQREAVGSLASANERLERANLSFASALVATLDARDRYTAGHSAAVAIYARDIAERLGLSAGECELAHLCGLVHDIGKVGLPAGLLEKEGPLSLDERRLMEQHSEIGERILLNVEGYHEIARIVRHHHERVDGNGYPDSLKADDIPLIARIIAVADAYDAMTSDRPYREAMPSRVARLRLAQAVESQFDTTVVAAFEAILAGATIEYRGDRTPRRSVASQIDTVALPASAS